MKTVKTDNAKIEIEIVNFTEAGDKHLIINFGQKDDQIVAIVPNSVVKTKFTDAAFAKHILNFLIKD